MLRHPDVACPFHVRSGLEQEQLASVRQLHVCCPFCTHPRLGGKMHAREA